MVLGGRPVRRRVGNIRHGSLRAACRDFAVRHSAHPDARRPERRLSRSGSREVAQGSHRGARGHPCGACTVQSARTAGKWGEWYPDVLGPDGKLTTAKPKPYWQPAWLKQADRLRESISAVRERVPLVMSGDLHAVAIGRMMRSGKLDFSVNPINAVLTGPISTRPSGWPSARRGTGALPPAHLDMDEEVKPIEQH